MGNDITGRAENPTQRTFLLSCWCCDSSDPIENLFEAEEAEEGEEEEVKIVQG